MDATTPSRTVGYHKNLRTRLDDVRRWHAEGLNDREIATRLGCAKQIARRWRKDVLGLPSQRDAWRAAVRERVRGLHARRLSTKAMGRELGCSRQRAHAMLRSLNLETAHEAAARRWPQAGSPQRARILEALAPGPKTALELSTLTGMRHGQRGGFAVANQLYALRHRGLVVSAGRFRYGRGRPREVYALAPGVAPVEGGPR